MERLGFFFFRAVETNLACFDEPVAEVAPDQFIDSVNGSVKVEAFECFIRADDHIIEFGKHPAFIGGQFIGGDGQFIEVSGNFALHLAETAGVPQFVRKVSAQFALVVAVTDVDPNGCDIDHGKAQGVRTVGGNDFQRVRRVAEGFAQLSADLVADDAGEVNVPEGQRTLELIPCHDHTGNPEEDDVRTGHQVIGRVEIFLFFRLFRPTHDGEGPQPGAEPGIQHIFFLIPAFAFGGGHAHIDFPVFIVDIAAVPGGDAVAPPDLTADAPVLNIFHPVEIGLGPAFGVELDRAGADSLDSGLCQFIHPDEPLVAEERFDLHAAPFGETHVVGDVFDLFQQALRFDVGNAQFAAFVTVQTGIAFAADRVHGAVAVHHIDERQIMTLAHLIVVGVVGGGDLHAAGTLFRIGVFVLDNGDLAVRQRQIDRLANQVFVAGIVDRNCHSRIAEQRFRTGRGDHQIAGTIRQRVTEVPELALDFLVDHFFVRERALGSGTPVHHAFAAVDVTLVIQLDKHLLDRIGKTFVHGEAFPFPVAGSTQFAELLDDRAAVLFLPVPDPFNEFFTPQRAAIDPFRFTQNFIHLAFRGDPGVVRAGEPADRFAHHAMPADQDVLKRIVQHMPHGQDTRHVRRGDHNGIGFLFRIRLAAEQPVILPVGIPFGFDFRRFVCFRHFRHVKNLQFYY